MSVDTIISLIETYKYWIIFPLACAEGPLLTFICGSLIALGYLHPVPTLFAVVMGDFVPDMIYYGMGYFGSKTKMETRFPKLAGHFDALARMWSEHTLRAMLLSKWAYGLSMPLLMSAAISKLPLSVYIPYTLSISIAQYIVLLTLGYFFGAYYAAVKASLLTIQIITGCAVVILIGVYFILGRYAKKKVMEEELAILSDQ